MLIDLLEKRGEQVLATRDFPVELLHRLDQAERFPKNITIGLSRIPYFWL